MTDEIKAKIAQKMQDEYLAKLIGDWVCTDVLTQRYEVIFSGGHNTLLVSYCKHSGERTEEFAVYRYDGTYSI